MTKVKKVLSVIASAVVMTTCTISNLPIINAGASSSYAMGDLEVSESDMQAFYSQFNEADCSVNLSNITSLPTACDLSTNEDSKYFPPIGEQGDIDSCAAWATTYYQYTYAANKLNNIITTSNNAYSPTWTYNYTNGGTNSGSYYTDAYNVLKNQGALTLAQMPYDGTKSGYNYSWSTDTDAMMNALHTRLSYANYISIPSTGTPISNANDTDLREAKFLLSTGHVLMVRVNANSLENWSYKTRRGNANEDVAYRASSASKGHALTVVGYNDNVECDVNGDGNIEDSERGAFKIANSWGTDWGNDGYMWVLYDALNNVSNISGNWESSITGTRIPIFERKSYDNFGNAFHFIEVENYDVNLAGLLTVSTGYRNKLRVNLFRNSSNSTSYTDANSISYLDIDDDFETQSVLNTSACFSGSIVFDYGEFDEPVSFCTNGYYFGADIINLSSPNSASFSNVSYKIIDDKFNVVKNISSISGTIANNVNYKGCVKIQCVKGDVDYDGSVTAADADYLLNYCAMSVSLSNLQMYLGDYNNDGTVNTTDVTSINFSLMSRASESELVQIKSINEQVQANMIQEGCTTAEYEKTIALNQAIERKLADF